MISMRKFKIGVLTSSRADFGIFYPLLKEIESTNIFDLKVIAFGSHCSTSHGHTINEILKDFKNIDSISNLISDDSENYFIFIWIDNN